MVIVGVFTMTPKTANGHGGALDVLNVAQELDKLSNNTKSF